jgi:lipopolysaccharide/colanic/teichoic acid biosynthesis glycosyltransferase
MKRPFDILIASFLIVLLSPLWIGISLAICLTSQGPVFFVQRRIGLKGCIFRMLKFRTMVQDAEKLGTGLYSFEDDPRITNLGRILRRTSLDELPQLFNVLAGSMSLVGPRPPVTYELGPWEDYTPEMRKRFDVKPGITGLAQISGRNELTWDEKILLDNLYVDRIAMHGACVDIPILLRTIWITLMERSTIEKELSSNISESSISARARLAGRRDLL